MSEEESGIVGRLRARGSKPNPRAEALDRLRAQKLTGKSTAQIKLDEPIYDQVDDEEYNKLVLKRRSEFGDFIVDDNGLGYGDMGQEEDWTLAGGPVSSDEEDEIGGERRKEKVKRKVKEKKEGEITKKPSGLAAAAALMGKQKISSIFANSIFSKGESLKKSFNSESIVDDVIAEFAPDEADREKRRRKSNRNIVLNSNSKSNLSSNVKLEKCSYGLGFGDEKSAVSVSNNEELRSECKEDVMEFDNGNSMNDESREGEGEKVEAVLSGDVDLKGSIEDLGDVGVKKAEVFAFNAKFEDTKDPARSATAGWKTLSVATDSDVSLGGNGGVRIPNLDEKTDLLLNEDGSLMFYIIDAYEEYYGANAGNIYLFGKVCRSYLYAQLF